MPKPRDNYHDGPRVAPTGGDKDDLFNARARPSPVTAGGLPPSDRDRERLLAGWLRRQMCVACPGCRGTIEWAGRWEDMPQCPACHRIPELEALIRFDGEFLELSRTPVVQTCGYCPKKISFVRNVNTGKEGPIATATRCTP
jgi:hypothetical protein